MLDQRYYRKCSNHQNSQTAVRNKCVDLSKNTEETETKTSEDAFSEYSVLWSDTESETSREEHFDLPDTDTDEGFYDKLQQPQSLVNWIWLTSLLSGSKSKEATFSSPLHPLMPKNCKFSELRLKLQMWFFDAIVLHYTYFCTFIVCMVMLRNKFFTSEY